MVVIHDTKMIMPIADSHPLAEIYQIFTFIKSLCESELINLIFAETEMVMLIQKGRQSPLKDNNTVTALKADPDIEYERSRMLKSLTGMFMDWFNVKGYEVSLDFNTSFSH